MSTDLAVRNETALATSTLGQDDMIMPRLRLVQDQSAYSDQKGYLFNSLTGEVSETVRVVALKVGKNRVMWPVPFVRDQQPLCASNDAVTPRQQYMGKYASRCEGCECDQWIDDRPPKCSFGYTYLLACRDSGDLPVILSAARTSLKAAKQANTLIRAFGVGFEIIIGTKQIVSDSGKYFVLTFTLGNAVEPEATERYASMSHALGSTVLAADTGLDDDASPTPEEPPWDCVGEEPAPSDIIDQEPPEITTNTPTPSVGRFPHWGKMWGAVWAQLEVNQGNVLKLFPGKTQEDLLKEYGTLENVYAAICDKVAIAEDGDLPAPATQEGIPPARPFNAPNLHIWLMSKAGLFDPTWTLTEGQRGRVLGVLNKMAENTDNRHIFLKAVWGQESGNDRNDAEMWAMWKHWMNCTKDPETGDYIPDDMAVQETREIVAKAKPRSAQQDIDELFPD